MCDFGTGNNNKLNWVLEDKQELIDIIETIYRGAKKGRGLVVSPKGKFTLINLLGCSFLQSREPGMKYDRLTILFYRLLDQISLLRNEGMRAGSKSNTYCVL